jgi:phage tail-like protein
MSSLTRTTGPPFLRLGTRTGWRPAPGALGAGVVESGGALVLGVAGRSPIAATEPFGTFGGRTLPRGLAIGGDGRLFLADPRRRVVLTWQIGTAAVGSKTAPFTPLWPARPQHPPTAPGFADPGGRPPADPYLLVRPTDVALSPAGDLVVADPGAGRVLVLAYPTARLRHVVEVPGWAPTALAFDHAGRAYVADPALGTVHRFWASWRRDRSFPHATAGLDAPEHVALVRHEHGPGACHACADHNATARPVIVALDGTTVVGLNDRGRRVPLTDVPGLEPGPLRRDDGDALRYDDPTLPWTDPVRITGLGLTRDGRHTASGLPLLAVPRRVVLPRAATFTTDGIDGGRPGFAWDRVALSVVVPENTRLLVSTLTDDSLLETGRVADTDAWAGPLSIGVGDAPELLVQSPAGRYLWLRMEFFGDGRATPRLEGIDVFGPRASSARYLPAAYHQDPESLRFLDRFLSYFDTVFAEIGATHREVAALLDPFAAPEGPALDWLGSWFDLDFLAEWSLPLRRRMIAEAVEYARERGTVRGLRRVLQWHTGLTDPLPQIIEHYRVTGADDGRVRYIGGEPLDATPVAHSCTIVLPERVAAGDAARAQLERLITEHIPGHVRFRVRLVPAGVTVGRQSTVGVDTLLGSPSPRALGVARLGRDLTTAAGPRSAVVLGSSLSHGRRTP